MGGNSGWDVVFPGQLSHRTMREMGLLSRLDHRSLPNLHNLDKPFLKPLWDPDLQWGVPYMWNSTGICYAKNLNLTAWSDLWRQELRGRITMLDDPVDVFAACLLKSGRSINTRDPADLRAAQSEALAQKPFVRAYVNAEVRDQLVAGDVLAAQLWSTTAQQAIDDLRAWLFVSPAKGFPLHRRRRNPAREHTLRARA